MGATDDSHEDVRVPGDLLDREDVALTTVERTVPPAAFEGLSEYYRAVDGVVQVGITDASGRLLLQGAPDDGDWAPPGGRVNPGEDWAVAARRRLETQTGVDIAVDGPELVEHLTFRCEDDSASFESYGVSFSASLAGEHGSFLENPDIVEHPQLPPDHDQTFAWVDRVPADANPRHVDHIELFLG